MQRYKKISNLGKRYVEFQLQWNFILFSFCYFISLINQYQNATGKQQFLNLVADEAAAEQEDN